MTTKTMSESDARKTVQDMALKSGRGYVALSDVEMVRITGATAYIGGSTNVSLIVTDDGGPVDVHHVEEMTAIFAERKAGENGV